MKDLKRKNKRKKKKKNKRKKKKRNKRKKKKRNKRKKKKKKKRKTRNVTKVPKIIPYQYTTMLDENSMKTWIK